MQQIIILGAGTAGATMANRLHARLPKDEWRITVVDREDRHFYQPGFLFIPFGIYQPNSVVEQVTKPLPRGVNFVAGDSEVIDAKLGLVWLKDGTKLHYDQLIIATGCSPRPDEVEGLTGPGWGTSAFEFYTYSGACQLAMFLDTWAGGRLVINVAEMPIKCPVAPIEFACLADTWLTSRGMREKVEIELVTPLPGAFTRPICSEVMGHMLAEKGIKLTTDYTIANVDSEAKRITDWEDRTINYDCLVIIPPNFGDDLLARSGLGDDMNYVPTDPQTLQAKGHDNIWVLGDATDLPSSKAGSVAHFQAEVLTENLVAMAQGKTPTASYDGHTNCFIETGEGKAVLVDFNYEVEPLPGKYPLAGVGPFSLLRESRANHWGKMAFRWMYWHLLVKGRSMLVSTEMSLNGKEIPPQYAHLTHKN